MLSEGILGVLKSRVDCFGAVASWNILYCLSSRSASEIGISVECGALLCAVCLKVCGRLTGIGGKAPVNLEEIS